MGVKVLEWDTKRKHVVDKKHTVTSVVFTIISQQSPLI